MYFNKILVGVDGSEHALKAARVAGELARCMQSELWVVACFDPVPKYLGQPYLEEAMTARVVQGNEIIQAALEAVGSIPGMLKTEILEGPPAEAILSVAEVREVDLIVMGTRGLGRLAGLLLGSQSQKVVTHASCPVMLIR